MNSGRDCPYTLRENDQCQGVVATRGGHLTEYEKGLKKSHMTKHWLDCHRGKEKAKFEVILCSDDGE